MATDKYSVGDFVMTGGELAAAAMVDSIVRLLPGVLGDRPSQRGEHLGVALGEGLARRRRHDDASSRSSNGILLCLTSDL